MAETVGFYLDCPGVTEYGHGLNAKTVHLGGCCARFADLPRAEKFERGLRMPSSTPLVDPAGRTPAERLTGVSDRAAAGWPEPGV